MTLTRAKLTTTLILATGWLGLSAGVARANATLAPPVRAAADARIAGQNGNLTIRNGVLQGRLAGGQYNAVVGASGARGSGPQGAIDVKLRRVAEGYELSGLWNGKQVFFVVGDRTVSGKAVRSQGAGQTGFGRCRFNLDKMANGRSYAGTAQCLGGASSGHIEVHPQAPADLTDAQNVILTVAYLAAPGGR